MDYFLIIFLDNRVSSVSFSIIIIRLYRAFVNMILAAK